MGVLKEKADQSFETAVLLIDQNFENPSFHCSYYSCIQLMLDVLHEKLNIDEQQLSNAVQSFIRARRKRGKKAGSHLFYIQKLREELFSRNVPHKEINQWYSNLTQLKKQREKADYGRIPCNPTDASKAKDKASDIRLIINNAFP